MIPLFLLADPSQAMLEQAAEKFRSDDRKITILPPVFSQDLSLEFKVDVVTAIQAHHYLSSDQRKAATVNCYRLLMDRGIYITFENIAFKSAESIEIGKKYWSQFQLSKGRTEEEVKNQINRFNREYFPVTIDEHLSLLKACGFKLVELFWFSYMQAGFFCIK